MQPFTDGFCRLTLIEFAFPMNMALMLSLMKVPLNVSCLLSIIQPPTLPPYQKLTKKTMTYYWILTVRHYSLSAVKVQWSGTMVETSQNHQRESFLLFLSHMLCISFCFSFPFELFCKQFYETPLKLSYWWIVFFFCSEQKSPCLLNCFVSHQYFFKILFLCIWEQEI